VFFGKSNKEVGMCRRFLVFVVFVMVCGSVFGKVEVRRLFSGTDVQSWNKWVQRFKEDGEYPKGGLCPIWASVVAEDGSKDIRVLYYDENGDVVKEEVYDRGKYAVGVSEYRSLVEVEERRRVSFEVDYRRTTIKGRYGEVLLPAREGIVSVIDEVGVAFWHKGRDGEIYCGCNLPDVPKRFYLIDLGSGEELGVVDSVLGFSPFSYRKLYLISKDMRRALLDLDVRGGEAIVVVERSCGVVWRKLFSGCEVGRCNISPNGRYVGVQVDDRMLIYDIDEDELLHSIPLRPKYIPSDARLRHCGVGFSEDGESFYIFSPYTGFTVLDLASGEELWNAQGKTSTGFNLGPGVLACCRLLSAEDGGVVLYDDQRMYIVDSSGFALVDTMWLGREWETQYVRKDGGIEKVTVYRTITYWGCYNWGDYIVAIYKDRRAVFEVKGGE